LHRRREIGIFQARGLGVTHSQPLRGSEVFDAAMLHDQHVRANVFNHRKEVTAEDHRDTAFGVMSNRVEQATDARRIKAR
jgi:hypothetical protein